MGECDLCVSLRNRDYIHDQPVTSSYSNWEFDTHDQVIIK